MSPRARVTAVCLIIKSRLSGHAWIGKDLNDLKMRRHNLSYNARWCSLNDVLCTWTNRPAKDDEKGRILTDVQIADNIIKTWILKYLQDSPN